MLVKSIEKLSSVVDACVIDHVSHVLRRKSSLVAETFYCELMKETEAAIFLDNEKVEQQLTASFTRWVEMIFCPAEAFCPEIFRKMHAEIGTIHARIGIPVELVDYGMQVVKDQCFQLYLSSADNRFLADGVVYINKLLDTCLSIINANYHSKTIDAQRNAQALRLKMTSADLSLECEKIKGELIRWNRDIVVQVVTNNQPVLESIVNIRHSNCGLWFVHKAGLYFPNSLELDQINTLLDSLTGFVKKEVLKPTKMMESEMAGFITALNNKVSEICWLLEQIAEKNHKENNAKDPLTQLLSRRFVDGILKREITLCHQQNERFGLMMIDIDNFKQVNDTYGHQMGDQVLRNVSSTIIQNVRPTDFCFRYGGEEILVVMSAANQQILFQKAEQIRHCIAQSDTLLDSGGKLSVTASIGIALYDGHPDYQRSISQADKHLYLAKRTGKNKVVGQSHTTEIRKISV